MKKRILSFFCVLALCLTLLPATAWAAEEYDFTVETTPVNFGSVSFVTVANAKNTVLITNTGTENIIVRVKQNEANFKYFVLDATSWSQEYQFKINGIGYYEATVAPNESVHVDIEIKFTNLTGASAGHYEETIHIPIYQKDGSTSIKPSFTAAFDWVEAKQEMEVTPASLDLGTVGQGYGDTQPVTFTIKNTGDLELDSVSCDLSFDGDQDVYERDYVTTHFKLTPNIFIPAIGGNDIYPLSLGVGESETIGVYVKQGLPQGTYTATLVVQGYNYDSEKYVYAYIPLTFTVEAAQYGISAAPATLNFGTAGLSNTQAEAQTVTITNTGNTIDTINLPSADNFEFAPGDGFSGNTATISQGRTASFTVQPKAGLSAGTYDPAITVTSTHDASAAVNLKFQVERKDCDLMADVSQLDFGYEQEGYDQPEGKTVTLTNVGSQAITVSLPTVTGYVLEGGDGFTQGSGDTAVIAKDGKASFTVRPATGLEQGSHPATLTITGSAAGQTANWPVALSFSVEPKVYAASVSPETVTFDGLRVGYEQPEAQTVTVTNTGNQALSLKLPSLEDYEIQAATGFDEEGVASLAVNGKASFTVRPAAGLAQGDHSDTLTLKLTSDDPDKSVTKDVALNCNIDETALEARPASFDFGTAQGSNYQVAERLTVTISVKSGVNGEYKIKIPANDPVFIFEPRDNFVLDEDGQFYTGTVKRVNGNVTQIAAFYLSVRNDLSPGNYDRELDLGCGLTLPLRFTVEALPHEITVSPQQLDFGTIVSGVDETPEEKTLTVTNTGTNNITVNLPSSTNYVVTGGEGFEDGKAALKSGAAASFTVRPKEDLTAKDYEEFLSITTDQNGVSKDILLKFTVETPDYTISCDPASLEFGTITVDDTLPQAQTVTITNEGNVTNTVSLPESDAFDLNGGAGFEDGTAVLAPEGTATFTVRPKAGLSADDYSGTLTLSDSGDSQVSLDVSYTVEKGQAAVTTVPQAVEDLTYTGSAQALLTEGEATGGTLVYSLEQDGEYTTAIPTGTNAGGYSVWYYVKGDDNHNGTNPVEVTATIAKADPTVTAPVPVTGLTYTGEEYELITAGTTTGGTLVYSLDENGEYTDTIPTGTAAQSYTVWYKVQGNENYNGTEAASVTAVIGNALAEVTEAPTANTLTYTGEAQALVAEGTATGGDMMYSLGDSGDFSDTVPTATNAGDYSVWYYVKGDENHSDTDPVEVKITIAKATPAYTVPTDLTATYGDTLANVDLTDGWAWDAPDTAVGNVGSNAFAATYTPEDADNYNTVPQNLTVTVSAKDITGAEITLGDNLTYTGQEQTQQITSVTVDGMAVTYTVSGNTGIDAGDYTLTITGTGNFTGEATQKWSIAKATYTGTTGVSGTVLANWPGEVTLPTIPAGASYGAPSTTDGLTGLSIEGGVLSYTGGTSIAEGQKYEITVPVDGGKNYNDYEITVTLTGKDKQVLDITGVTGQGGTYNGQTQAGYTGTPSAQGYTGDFTVTYNTTDDKAPTNAGNYAVTIAIPDSDPQYVGSIVLEFTIAKKALTVSAPSASVYVGDSAPKLALTYTGLVDGESVTPSEAPAFTITKSDGTEITLADAVKTAGTYTITWSNANDTTFTSVDNYDITLKNTGTLTVTVRSSGGGGSSSGSGNKTETTTNPDGSTTTTVTSSNGTVTETTKFPDGSKEVIETKKDGTVTTTTTDTTGNKTQVVENTDGTKETTITNKDGSSSATTVDETGKTQAEVKLPAAVVEDAQGEAVTLPMPEVPITTDRETAPTVTVDLPGGGSAKVEIPVEDVTPGTVAVIVKADGTEEVIKTSLTTENGVAVTLSDGDTVKVVDNSKTFEDVPATYWGAEAVDFATSRELFVGTSETTFAPDTAMTRAMIVTVLARFEGVDTTTGSTWYEAGQQWAMQNGVSDGSNMDASLTREQLVTMFYRYAQSKGYDTTQGGMAIREYADFEQISDYAAEAMTWAVNTGIINGTSSTTISPQGPATRAQVATILMRFIEGMA